MGKVRPQHPLFGDFKTHQLKPVSFPQVCLSTEKTRWLSVQEKRLPTERISCDLIHLNVLLMKTDLFTDAMPTQVDGLEETAHSEEAAQIPEETERKFLYEHSSHVGARAGSLWKPQLLNKNCSSNKQDYLFPFQFKHIWPILLKCHLNVCSSKHNQSKSIQSLTLAAFMSYVGCMLYN